MSERQKLVHLHTSGTTAPSPSILNLGEIAVQHASEESCLYIKNQDGDLIKFIESGTIKTMVDNVSIDCGFYYEEPDHYLTFEAVSANSTVRLNRVGNDTGLTTAVLQYSIDNGTTWSDYSITKDGNVYTGQEILLENVGDTVKFKGNNEAFGYDFNNYHNFVMTGKIKASGDITSLNNEIGGDCSLANYCYFKMFYNCASLTTAPELPATILATYCYSSMFYNCTSLTTAPELPATILATYCYSSMFYNCASLVTAPELPATTLAESCYNCMFKYCTSLIVAPELPATTLANRCYESMFDNCTSLTTAPELTATTLAWYCYQKMFYCCAALTTAPSILPATTLENYCYNNMFGGCTSLTIAPELPATTLAGYCYNSMFAGCTNLNYIKAMFTTVPSYSYTGSWVSGVSSTGTFVKNSAAEWDVTGTNGVPSGWTVQNAA